MFEQLKQLLSGKQPRLNQTPDMQLKNNRKLTHNMARSFVWAMRIFLACVIVITTYNVALALCDTMQNNYTLWLSSTIASISFCAVSLIIIAAIYLCLRSLTKAKSKTNI